MGKSTVIAFILLLTMVCSCSSEHAEDLSLKQLTAEMGMVRDYVPSYPVIAHRGTTYWAPEETEAAWRWAREMGADYLESDLQITKDGVILANHDEDLQRTTNIKNVYGDKVPESRRQFYIDHGCSEEQATAQYEADVREFRPYYAMSYMYDELLRLDTGTWFNLDTPDMARAAFSAQHQYVSTLEDQIRYAEGMRLARDKQGERRYTISGTWNAEKPKDCLTYTMEYTKDEQDTGHRPGVYLEFKEPWLNGDDFEERVYSELDRLGWNILTKPATDEEYYKAQKVNVGKTKGKVILQTFSRESLVRATKRFGGRIPMCLLLWKDDSSDPHYDTIEGYAEQINFAIEHGAHIIGPSIAGAPNNYYELNNPWQAKMIKKAGLLNHPYSFDTMEQTARCFGMDENGEQPHKTYGDAAFTNRTELTLRFFLQHGLRSTQAMQNVPDAEATLQRLGY